MNFGRPSGRPFFMGAGRDRDRVGIGIQAAWFSKRKCEQPSKFAKKSAGKELESR